MLQGFPETPLAVFDPEGMRVRQAGSKFLAKRFKFCPGAVCQFRQGWRKAGNEVSAGRSGRGFCGEIESDGQSTNAGSRPGAAYRSSARENTAVPAKRGVVRRA